MSKLFSPIRLAGQELPNRIVVSPMCQYSADDGCANEWHLQNLMNLGMSGAGLVMVEATARLARSARGHRGQSAAHPRCLRLGGQTRALAWFRGNRTALRPRLFAA